MIRSPIGIDRVVLMPTSVASAMATLFAWRKYVTLLSREVRFTWWKVPLAAVFVETRLLWFVPYTTAEVAGRFVFHSTVAALEVTFVIAKFVILTPLTTENV